ncbi:MAG: outer membrane protein assembly factor BamD [Holosporales bacterium]|jgi:outer membrane protein assembly factor BamD|nr:outer membrane protein assembly factor BamD [Holosporales bacterium]
MKAKNFRIFCLMLALAFSVACNKEKPYEEKSVYAIYTEGLEAFKKKDFYDAAKAFQEIERQHPYSDWAPKAQLMSAFCYYMDRKYDDSIRILNALISYYPNYRYIDYAQYLLATSYLQQVPTADRDVADAIRARDSFIELSKRYPNSTYAQQAIKNVELLDSILAAHDMHIGRYYQSRNNAMAALERFRVVINSFAHTDQISEAYFRVMECYLCLGIIEEAHRYYEEMTRNTTESIWTAKARKLLRK